MNDDTDNQYNNLEKAENQASILKKEVESKTKDAHESLMFLADHLKKKNNIDKDVYNSISTKQDETKAKISSYISDFFKVNSNEDISMGDVERSKYKSEKSILEENIVLGEFVLNKLSENPKERNNHEKELLEIARNKHHQAINEYTAWANSKQSIVKM